MGIAVKPQLRRATCLLWETVKNSTRDRESIGAHYHGEATQGFALVVTHKSGGSRTGVGAERLPRPGQVIHALEPDPHGLRTWFAVPSFDVTA
jgi:hypothetical protein